MLQFCYVVAKRAVLLAWVSFVRHKQWGLLSFRRFQRLFIFKKIPNIAVTSQSTTVSIVLGDQFQMGASKLSVAQWTGKSMGPRFDFRSWLV